MMPNNKLRASLAAAVLAGGFGVAAAQPSETETMPSVPPAAGGERNNLGAEQMLQEGTSFIPGMEQSAQTIRRQLETARDARDVVKVLCLNDKLNQVDVALRSARDRLLALRGSVDRKELEQARHEYTVLVVLRDRIRALMQESSQCIGEETGFVGDSRVTVDIDPAMPQDDPTVFPEESVVTVPPIISSPNR